MSRLVACTRKCQMRKRSARAEARACCRFAAQRPFLTLTMRLVVCRKAISMSLSDQDESVKKRAVDNIMKLINSQLALEKKQAKMDAKVRSRT